MFIQRKNGATSNILRVMLRNSSTGAGLTGLTSASSGLIISTICDNETTATAYTVAGGTIESITTLGTFATPTATKCRFKEVDSTNHPGLYELQFADARFAVSAPKVLRICLSGATNLLAKDVVVQLTAIDHDDATSHGISRLDATVSSRASQTSLDTVDDYVDTEVAAILAAVDTEVAAIKAKTDNLPAAPAATGDCITAAGVRSAVGLSSANLDTQLSTIYGVIDTEVAAIKAKTDNLPSSPAATGDAMALTSGERTTLAQSIFKLDLSAITGEASRSLLNAVRFLRNKWSISGTTLTVTKEDDATTAWSGTVTTNASADPITGNDPS